MSNEAAERLVREWGPGDLIRDKNMLQDVEWTLATERKAVVERIRAAMNERWPARDAEWVWIEGIRAILDAEAAR